MGTQQPIRKTVAPEIPDKLYFRIGDVARLCEVPTYVLRFWETEFPQLKPNKGGTGQRLYRRRDVELALRIKGLLYDQGYTIPGARQVFKNEAAARSAEAATPAVSAEPVAMPSPVAAGLAREPEDMGAGLRQMARLRDLREEMAALLDSLGKAPGGGPAAVLMESKPEPKMKTLRPRLVLEPWPSAAKRDGQEGAGGPRLQVAHTNQRDLFGTDTDPEDEWPEPPVAS